MRNPKYTKRNLPSVFNFKVNPCHLHPDDWDLLFTLEKDSVGNVWVCYWVDPIDKRVKTTLYNTKEVLEFVNGYSCPFLLRKGHSCGKIPWIQHP